MKLKYIFGAFALALPIVGTTPCQAQKNDHNLEVAKQLEIFCDIYRDLDMMYVDSLDAKEVVGTGIKAMLRSLDPYTEYYPQADIKELKQMITGKYGGIGSVVSYNLREDATVINEPYYGMPAHEAGLRKGDIILSIDGEEMKGKSTTYVSEHLRGEAGTSFILKVLRPSAGKAQEPSAKKGRKDGKETKGKVMSFKLTRRAIQMPAMPYYGMLTDSIGYINLTQFTEDCSKDVRHALIDLKRRRLALGGGEHSQHVPAQGHDDSEDKGQARARQS